MPQIVSVPHDLLNQKTIALGGGSLRFKPEIEEWCSGQLRDSYSIHYENLAMRQLVDFPWEVTFANDNDAVTFKLFWL